MRVRFFFALCLGLCCSGIVAALDYRSISVPVAVLYDAPSAQGKKLFLVKEGMPLEVLVEVEGWTKIRDAEGTIAWVERGVLAPRRTVVVLAETADILKEPAVGATTLLQVGKWVALDLLEAGPAGWAKVRHQDGTTGFVRATQVWGV